MRRGIPIIGTVDDAGRVQLTGALLSGLEKRIVALLRRFGEVSTGFVVGTVAGRGVDAAAVERALCDLMRAGAIDARRETGPRRHGAGRHDRVEVTYWRPAEPGDDPCPS
jgi:hypothetical protein